MNKFQVGDKVERIAGPNDGFDVGQIGEITQNTSANHYSIKLVNGYISKNNCGDYLKLVSTQITGITGQVYAIGNGWQTASSTQKKWYLNKNETIYFWDEKAQNYGLNWTFEYFKSYSNCFKTSYNLSQQEIDQIMKEIKEEQQQLQLQPMTGINWNDTPKSPAVSSPAKKTCAHEMIPYVGAWETFNYCKKCNEKEK